MFYPNCLPLLIGSLPVTDHNQAVHMILEYTPEIPLWPQLPKFPKEGMIRQFLTGFPGLVEINEKKYYIDAASEDFEEQMTAFYTDFMACEEDPLQIESSTRFKLGDDTAKGFAEFIGVISQTGHQAAAMKGQITGPVTVGIGVRDHNSRSIIYDDNLRDMLIKHLAMKAKWQISMLRKASPDTPVILLIDEPGIVSFGSSGFSGITREMVTESVADIIHAIRQSEAIAGVHICANGDWSAVLSSTADIISFDAYFYFENFLLYRDQLTHYLKRGGFLAWGIIPTSDPEVIEAADGPTLFSLWEKQVETMAQLGISGDRLKRQTFIAPSCGTGSLPPHLAQKVLRLTREVSLMARNTM